MRIISETLGQRVTAALRILGQAHAGSKKGAGILRTKPNIKWDKVRGKEPERDKREFPWFWKGSEFTGDRVNDVHLTREQKEGAKK